MFGKGEVEFNNASGFSRNTFSITWDWLGSLHFPATTIKIPDQIGNIQNISSIFSTYYGDLKFSFDDYKGLRFLCQFINVIKTQLEKGEGNIFLNLILYTRPKLMTGWMSISYR